MFRDILNRLRSRKVEIRETDRESLRVVYRLFYDIRRDLVEAFYKIKSRRLREIYDEYSMMMVKYDKLFQYMRRVLNESLYAKYDRLSPRDFEEHVYKLPLEFSLIMRNLANNAKQLLEFSSTSTPLYLRSIVKNIDSILDDVASYIESIVSKSG